MSFRGIRMFAALGAILAVSGCGEAVLGPSNMVPREPGPFVDCTLEVPPSQTCLVIGK